MRRKEEKKQSQAADSALGLTYGASGQGGGRGAEEASLVNEACQGINVFFCLEDEREVAPDAEVSTSGGEALNMWEGIRVRVGE